MTDMTSRERALKALRHEEPDRVPYDLAGTHVSGIAAGAYRNLRDHLGMPPDEPEWLDVIQQVVIPGDDLLARLEVDTRGLFPLCAHNWDVHGQCRDDGDKLVYLDEWGCTHHFPKAHGHWFSLVGHPLESADPTPEAVEAHDWPDAADRRRVAGLREKAEAFRAEGKLVVVKGLAAGVFEMAQRLRGMENSLLDPMMFPEMSDRLFGRIADLKIEFWEMALGELGDVVDVVVETDDYGTQDSQLVSPDQWRATLKPHVGRLFDAIKRAAPDAALFFHSCGMVRPFLPDFIEMGVDILNPVHISAKGMAPEELKKDFGDDLVFWGGGVETQSVLPNGTPDEVRDNVKRNLDALAPGGGFVFNTIHNIQSEVPPANVMAMWETLMEFGRY